MHGGDRIADALRAHGVQHLFALCGGHVSPILTGAKSRGIRIVDVRDEATAVFAADAVARLGTAPGVAVVTAGPGLTNTITAIKNAQSAESPLVLLGGGAPTLLKGRGALQDIDQMALMVPHVKFARRAHRVRDLAPAIEQACAVARSGVPGPVFLEIPIDVLYPESTVREMYGSATQPGNTLRERLANGWVRGHLDRMFRVTDPAAPCRPIAAVVPSLERHSVVRALRLIETAARPMLIVGSEALADPVRAGRVAEAVTRLGIPTWLAGMARGLLGPGHPLQMRHERRAALHDADCVVLAGVPCDFRLDYGQQIRSNARVIAINRSLRAATLNRRPAAVLLGDVGLGLEALAQRLIPTAIARWTSWIEALRERDQARAAQITARSRVACARVNPITLLHAIERAAGAHARFVLDGGDFVGTAAHVLSPKRPLAWLDPGPFGTLGVGMGFAIGSRCLDRDAEIWLILGDGACGYGLVEFDTLVRHRLPVIAVVGNDGGWTQIAREQVKLLGDDVGTKLARNAYHEVAAAFGAAGLLLERDANIEEVLNRARRIAASGCPVLVNALLEPADFREGSISI